MGVGIYTTEITESCCSDLLTTEHAERGLADVPFAPVPTASSGRLLPAAHQKLFFLIPCAPW